MRLLLDIIAASAPGTRWTRSQFRDWLAAGGITVSNAQVSCAAAAARNAGLIREVAPRTWERNPPPVKD